MNSKTYAIITILCAGGLFAYLWLQSTGPGPYDDFARCMTEKGFSMAGTNTCPSCQEQKRLFGSSFQYLDFHNCESDRGWCTQRGIKKYPTWIMPGGEKVTGVSSLKYLSDLSNCSIEKPTACENCGKEQDFCAVGENSPSCASNLSTTLQSKEMSQGLVAHWSFDEEGGSTVKDSVDNLEGSIYGGAKFEKGKRELCLVIANFNGDYTLCDSLTDLELKEKCYTAVAVSKNSHNSGNANDTLILCEHVTDDSLKGLCIMSNALRRQNKEICEKIPLNKTRIECIKNVQKLMDGEIVILEGPTFRVLNTVSSISGEFGKTPKKIQPKTPPST